MEFQSEYDVQEALEIQLQTALDGSNVDIAWPSVSYTPVQGQAYIRPDFIPGSTSSVGIGEKSKNRLLGFYQISIRVPGGQGSAEMKEIHDRIRPLFKKGMVIHGSNGLKIRVQRWNKVLREEDTVWLTDIFRAECRSDLIN